MSARHHKDIDDGHKHQKIAGVQHGSLGQRQTCLLYTSDARVRVLHKKNGGLSDARNAGVDAAAGEYLSFVDGDDWVSPYLFSKTGLTLSLKFT